MNQVVCANLLGGRLSHNILAVDNEAQNSTDGHQKSKSQEDGFADGASGMRNPDSPSQDDGQQQKGNSKDL